MSSVLDIMEEFFGKVKTLFTGGNDKKQLSQFQEKKLLHEFHMFYDVNKDGKLQWKDFELARQNICQLNGWKVGSEQYNNVQELFIELWRNLQDVGDEDIDGEITPIEWISMWTHIHRAYEKAEKQKEKLKDKQEKKGEDAGGKEPDDPIPTWFHKYIEYKFQLYDRANDGVLDVDEFEYCLNSGFDVPSRDCRSAFMMFTKSGEAKVDLEYFRQLAMEFYLSDDPSALGNFINGKLTYDVPE